MALTDESTGNGFFMPVAPAYQSGGGFGGFGNDGWWIILLLLCGWGGGFGMGGFGGGQLGYDFPWLLNGQQGINNNVSDGFRDAQIHDGITSIRDGIGNLATQLCGCCSDTQMAIAGVNANISNTAAQGEIAANARQMATLQQMFGIQSGIADSTAKTATGIADLRYTVAQENCADRQAINEGIRDILAAQSANTQRVLDQLCQDKIDSKNDTIAQLRQELMFARGQASQDVQTAAILAGQTNEVDALYTRLNNCPVPTTPVYGRQPIFTCGNGGCGCGVA